MAPFSMSQNVPWTAFYPGDTKIDQTVSTQQGVSLQEHVKCGSGPNPVKGYATLVRGWFMTKCLQVWTHSAQVLETGSSQFHCNVNTKNKKSYKKSWIFFKIK